MSTTVLKIVCFCSHVWGSSGSHGSNGCLCIPEQNMTMWELHGEIYEFASFRLIVDLRRDFQLAVWMNRDTILRLISGAPLQTLSRLTSSTSSPAPAASTPACGAGATRRSSPPGTTAARSDGRTGQHQGLGSPPAGETMDLNVPTVSCQFLLSKHCIGDKPSENGLNELILH